ncbi:MAG: hypothetical protein AB7V16_13655 [Vulcanibacillus sp.]
MGKDEEEIKTSRTNMEIEQEKLNEVLKTLKGNYYDLYAKKF